MLELPLGSAPLRTLAVRERRMREALALAPVNPAGFSLSDPQSIPLDDKLVGADFELAAFWKTQRKQFEFDYVTFRCDFAPAEGAPIERAWIEVKLQGPNQAGSGAIVWSMSPFLAEDLGKATYSGKIGADYQLFKTEIGTTLEKPVKNWFVRARGEQQPQASWEFRDNGSSRVEGTYRMSLVVRRRRGEPVNGSLDVGMVIAKRTFLFFKEREEKEGNPTVFSLPASE